MFLVYRCEGVGQGGELSGVGPKGSAYLGLSRYVNTNSTSDDQKVWGFEVCTPGLPTEGGTELRSSSAPPTPRGF